MGAVKIGDIVRVRLGPDATRNYGVAVDGKLFKVHVGWPGGVLTNTYFCLYHYPNGGMLTIEHDVWWIHISNLEPITKFEARTYEIIHGTENA